ncbi:MAG TPA: hypothetical protein VFW82_14015, partial [Dyella sp.]|nr:hypothetical protein [Dyella sp.]
MTIDAAINRHWQFLQQSTVVLSACLGELLGGVVERDGYEQSKTLDPGFRRDDGHLALLMSRRAPSNAPNVALCCQVAQKWSCIEAAETATRHIPHIRHPGERRDPASF